MAKVNSPLLSGKARGQIMKSLVFFPWKSINAVRQYIVPSDPNTAAQQAQRAKMAAAVTDFHGTSFTDKDKTAFNKWAATLAQVMSGFNAYVKEHIRAVIAGDLWKKIYNALETNPGATDVDIELNGVDCGTFLAKLHWGTSPTFMPNEDEVACALGVWIFDMDELVDGVTYYYWIGITAANIGGRTGIYKYTHVAP